MTSRGPAATRTATIQRLALHEVRSYERLSLELQPGVTVLVGPNGVGKTNLLESCAVALTGSSPRTSSELRLVREGATAARIAARVAIDDDVHDRDVVLQLGRGKQLRVDANVVRSVEEYASRVPAVTFLPERLLVIRGAPQRRRALVDQLAARVVRGAGQLQRDYAKVLQHRNALLRRARLGHDVDAQLHPWNTQLLEHGERYREIRVELLELLQEPYRRRFAQLTELQDARFEASLRGSGDLAADLQEVAAQERRRGTTLLGPHLDDVLPRAGSRDLRAFGSTGEQRAALLAFTFAARDLLAAHAGVQPVVLLDEPWAELDAERRRRLSTMLRELGQVLVTTTEQPAHLRDVVPHAAVYEVSSGAVRPWRDPSDTTA